MASTPKQDDPVLPATQGITIGRLRLHGWQSWLDIYHRGQMNWIDIEVVRLHFEHAYYKESVEMNVSLIGFNVCIEWWYGDHYK